MAFFQFGRHKNRYRFMHIFTWLGEFPAAMFKANHEIRVETFPKLKFNCMQSLICCKSIWASLFLDTIAFCCCWCLFFWFHMINVTAYISISGCFFHSPFVLCSCGDDVVMSNKMKIKRRLAADHLNDEKKVCSDNFKWSSYLLLN